MSVSSVHVACGAHTDVGRRSANEGSVLARFPVLLVADVGDSRAYRLPSDRLEQLTVDHSVAQELADRGALARDEIPSHRARHVITRAIGAERSPADFWLLPIATGERMLLCSDGLSGELTEEATRAGVLMGGAPGTTGEALIDLALETGGRDNVTAIVIDVLGGAAASTGGDSTSSSRLGATSDGDDPEDTAESVTRLGARRRRAHAGDSGPRSPPGGSNV